MPRCEDSYKLTRSEQNSKDVQNFLKSNAESVTTYLYSSEISRLEKEFPQIKIEKGNPFKHRLYICIIRKRE